VKIQSSILQWITAVALRTVVHLICATCRLEVVGGGDPAADLRQAARPVVFSFWHNRAVFISYYIYRTLLRRGFPITVLVSQSRDGELGARLAQMWGAGVVRGSASRGGAAGLRRLYREVAKKRRSAITIPDGPHGPLYKVKPGAVVLAQMSGAPIVPLAYAASSFWTIRSWDRMIIPKPFSTIRLVFGSPLEISRELSPDQLEHERLHLEATLNQLVAQVETVGEAAT